MPPKRNRDERQRSGAAASANSGNRSSKQKTPSNASSGKKEQEHAFEQLQEVFAGSIDPEVIYIILSENDFKVDAALDILFKLNDPSVDLPDSPAAPKLSFSNMLTADEPKDKKSSTTVGADSSSSGSNSTAKWDTTARPGFVNGVDTRMPADEIKNYCMAELFKDQSWKDNLQNGINGYIEDKLRIYRKEPPVGDEPTDLNNATFALSPVDPNLIEVFPNPAYYKRFYDSGGCKFNIRAKDLGCKVVKPFTLPTRPQRVVDPTIEQLPSGKVLCLMRGLPGSGKSTLARHLVSDGSIFSTDDYFLRNGRYQFNPNDLGTAHEWNQKRAKIAMQIGRTPIIIDNTNVQSWEMIPYVSFAKNYDYDVVVREPTTSWKFIVRELVVRNSHGLAHETIARMYDRYDHSVNPRSLLRAVQKTNREMSPSPMRREENEVTSADEQINGKTTPTTDDVNEEDSDNLEGGGEGEENGKVEWQSVKKKKRRKKKKVPTATLR